MDLEDRMTGSVMITGMGVISAIGDDVQTFFESLVAGRSGIDVWRRTDLASTHCKIGGDLSAYDVEAWISRRATSLGHSFARAGRRLLRGVPISSGLVALAAIEACAQSECLSVDDTSSLRFGHAMGGDNVQNGFLVSNAAVYTEERDYIDPLAGLKGLDTDALSITSELLGVRGPSCTIGGACASGNMAVIQGMDWIRTGRADRVLVTGAPFDVDPVTLHSWALMDAVATRSFNESPSQASRPFDTRREGFVPSHAAGALVLESAECARARGARALAELRGGALTSSASRSTKPDQSSQKRAMLLALADARTDVCDVTYVNAHATSTPLGDAVEAAAIRAVLGRHADCTPVNATKSMLGHTLTASGVVELIATILQLRNGVLHPTINLEHPEPGLGLNLVGTQVREHRAELALSNSFGFGGLNSCVIVGVPRDGHR